MQPVDRRVYATEPNKVWYVKDFYSDELLGPFSYDHANILARRLSKTNNSGVTELLVDHQGSQIIVGTYTRGTLRAKGKRSRDRQKMRLPPTM